MKTTQPPSGSPFEHAQSAPAFDLGIPARIPDLGPNVASDSTFYIDVEPGGKPNEPPDAASEPYDEGPLEPGQLRGGIRSHRRRSTRRRRPGGTAKHPQPLCPAPARSVSRSECPRGCSASIGRHGRRGSLRLLRRLLGLDRLEPLRRNHLSSAVRRATLRITVTERGNLESCVTVDGICEVNANQIKIISLVPEGTKVKKGDIVCKFDSSEIDKNIAQQDIKVKQAVVQDRNEPAGEGDPAQQRRERDHRRQGRAGAGRARPGEVSEGRLPRRDHQAERERSGSRRKTWKRQ